jgi:hypothetical protein
MASNRYVRCLECKGSGSTSTEIGCGICSGVGKTACDKCRNGTVECIPCNGTGKQRALVFFSATCTVCQGKGKIQCAACRGTSQVTCQKCGGSGRTSTSKPCASCAGKGKVEDSEFRAWVNSLREFSVDRLKDEKNRRQHKVQDARSKIGQLQAALREGWDDWETDPGSSNNCRHGWTPSSWGENREITELEERISNLEEELDIIQEILDIKLK